jgi:N-acetylneuraminic acid mutarotase
MPDPPRFYVAVAALGDRVFVIGGFMAPQSTVAQAFDTKTQTWQTLEPLPSAFSMPNVAVVGDRLFVLGGLQTQTVVEYDSQGHWVTRAPMPLTNGRGSAFVGVWGTKVVLAGGVLPGQSNNALNTGVRMTEVVAYDSSTDTWQTLAPMTEARGYGMGAVVGDKFWVIGGSTNDARTAAVQTLDLVAGTWNDDPPLDQSLSSAAIALVGDRIYLIGGIASSSGIVSPATLLYNRSDGMLTGLASMPSPRFGSGAAAVGGRIYVAGGIMMGSPTDFHPVTTFDSFTP